ncbi:MAG TPA: Npt1/Npt2 family nucleotide transporter, partial [Myxococcota bacterium]|nr:Npt1/Npt2 family nucleotide transporter [Myxococcota bacterium]
WLLLWIVAIVQGVITITDFQFNEVIEHSFTDTDARTRAIGHVYAFINFGSLLLQVGTGPLLRLVGLPLTLLGVPALLGASIAAFAAAPGFGTMAVAKVVGKCADYSVFRAAKEILYIPLTYAEKTQGKALVDMLTYRVAKGGVSLLLLGLAGLGVHVGISYVNVGLCSLWLALTVAVLRRYHARGGGDVATGRL